jgi:hypothetical protein
MAFGRTAALVLAALAISTPASAQVIHSLQVSFGGFFPRGLDSRPTDDVLVRNYFGESVPAFPSRTDALAFEVSDFRSGQVHGEWSVAFGPRVEFSAGLGFYSRNVPTVYFDFVDQDDREIEQRLRLRVVPITGIVRFLPFGREGDVQPYVGAGIAALNYRYSEIGDFLDPLTLDVFNDRFVTTGTVPGALLLGGVRFPLGGDIYGLVVEGRYQYGRGETGGIEQGFLAEKIDLSGGQFNVGLIVRF